MQGSNLFVSLEAIMAAGCFDEGLPACTDRDLMIRLLDIPWVKPAFSASHTVRHFAPGGPGRLSSTGNWIPPTATEANAHPVRGLGITYVAAEAHLPGAFVRACFSAGELKNRALDIFWQKYHARMTSEQRLASAERCKALFGWSPPSLPSAALPGGDHQLPLAAQPCRNRMAGREQSLTGGPVKPLRLADEPQPCAVLVGIIATCAPTAVLRSLCKLKSAPEIEHLDCLILDNGGGQCSAVLEAQSQGLRCMVISFEQQRRDARAGLFGELIQSVGVFAASGRPVSMNRTMLQHYLYHYAKLQDLEAHGRYPPDRPSLQIGILLALPVPSLQRRWYRLAATMLVTRRRVPSTADTPPAPFPPLYSPSHPLPITL